jgi:RimJ/RimL family protein N-acetyltransferase
VRLETERLVIRPWQPDEAPRLLDILSRADIVRWLGTPTVMVDLDEARERIQTQNEMLPPLGIWAAEVAATGVSAGSVMLVEIPKSAGADAVPLVQIGWYLHPDSTGQGYAAEAAAAVLAHGHAVGLTEIRALTLLANHPSIAVAKRIGMRHLGVTHEWYDDPSEVFISP